MRYYFSKKSFLTDNIKRILIFDTLGAQGLRGLRGNLSCDCLCVKAKHWKNKTKSNTKKDSFYFEDFIHDLNTLNSIFFHRTIQFLHF